MAKALLDMGVDVDQGKDYAPNENALFSALVRDDVEMVRLLLEHGANARLDNAVIDAITGPNPHAIELVKLLEQYGADLHEVFTNELADEPMNALSTAIDWGQDEVAEYLRSKGCVLPEGSEQPVEAAVVDEKEVVKASAAPELRDEVIAYFSEHFGPVDELSVIEIVPTEPRIVVHAIPPSEERNHVTLFTTGMSDQPMTVPPGEDAFQWAELFIQLPRDWNYRAIHDANHGWPVHWLRQMAQYPQLNDTWLGGPVALVANGESPEPLAPNTKFTTLLLMAEHDFTSREGHKIHLYRMTPLYTEERQLEIDEGMPALMLAFDRHSTPFIVDLNRPNVALLG
jgi:hypothetical protein